MPDLGVAGGLERREDEVVGVDVLAAGEHDGPLDDVLHLADVARPAVAQQLFHRPRREALELAAGFGD